MTDHTLFGELAIRLGPHPENVATEALQYILVTHPVSWPALRAFLQPAELSLPERLTFRTQVTGDDDATPDLVGHDAQGQEVLVVESKFWAALTDNQPAAYLRRLPLDRDALLLFVAPTSRLSTLWPKLLSRCREAGVDPTESGAPSTELRLARVGRMHSLALASWRAILGSMARDAEARGASRLAVDLSQLRGLCDRMDTDAFLPLRAAEIAPEIGRRVHQLADLVDQVVSELVARYGATRGGLSTGGWQATYGRFFLMHGLGCFFCYSPSLWAKHGFPMWLCIQEADWSQTERIRNLVGRRALSSGSVFAETPKGPALPIELPTGLEHADVLAHVVARVSGVLESCGPDTTGLPSE